tara:strand:- start:20 stop:1015 length:996 start_codon:yes stop_codon:yes gene_type:complete
MEHGMNQDPNNTQQGGQSNPFTGDLKGEFTSDFGTNTNAVSQIFKSDGFSGGDRSKSILLGIVFVAVIVGAYIFTMDDEFGGFEDAGMEETFDDNADTVGDDVVDPAEEEMGEDADDEGMADMSKDDAAAEDGEMAAENGASAEPTMANSGSLSIVSPGDGASVSYDETAGPAVFEWEGSADRILFSRNADMNPASRSIPLNGRSNYSFHNPHPGTWYWQLENSDGTTEVQRFVVAPPVRRNFPIVQPQSGSNISNGSAVVWEPDRKVAHYQVQMVTQGGSWANPQYRFGTSGNSVSIENVTAGVYDVRVGAYSEVAGRWEWQRIDGVSVQ